MSESALGPAAAWIDPIGWALLHSLWQGAAVAGLFAAARWLLRHRSAEARYGLGCVALAVMVATPALTVWYAHPPLQTTVPAETPAIVMITGPPTADTALIMETAGVVSMSTAPPPAMNWSQRLDAAMPWLVGGWLFGVALFGLRLVGGWAWLQRLRYVGTAPLPDQVTQRLHRLGERMGRHRLTRATGSYTAAAPAVIGWWRPMILLPVSMLTELSPWQLDAILAHELAHVRRRDYLVNLLQCLVETLLFYHPAVWWVSGVVRQEREHCCDDLAARVCGSRGRYAEALLKLAETRHGALLPSATGGDLSQRVRRLLGIAKPSRPSFFAAPLILVVLSAVALSLPGLVAAEVDEAGGGHEATPAGIAPEADALREIEEIEAEIQAFTRENDIALLDQQQSQLTQERAILERQYQASVVDYGEAHRSTKQIGSRINTLNTNLDHLSKRILRYQELVDRRDQIKSRMESSYSPRMTQRIIGIPYQKLLAGDMRYNLVIRPGDVIRVPKTSSGFVYIMGAINRPGAYTVPGSNDLTLKQLIASAGNFQTGDSLSDLYIDLIRRLPDGQEVIASYRLRDLFEDQDVSDPFLAKNDLVLVRDHPPDAIVELEALEQRIAELRAGIRSVETVEVDPDTNQAKTRIIRALTRRLEVAEKQRSAALSPALPEPPGPEDPLAGMERAAVEPGDLVPDMREYAIGPGDLLTVVVPGLVTPGLESVSTRRVSETGVCRLPVIGEVALTGMTAEQAEDAIRQTLAEDKDIRDAEVSVILQESRQNTFSIIGEPAQGAGILTSYVIPKPDFRLLDALAMAKGIPGSTKQIYVIRQEATTTPD